MNRGDRFERYQIVELVGRGAMGQVFRAKDSVTLNEVALKIVFAPLAGEDRDVIEAERFGAELQRRLSLADTRVVRVNRYGDLDGHLFVDMEYIEGQDVATALAHGPLDPKFAAYVARELCQTLENLRAFTTTIGTRHFAGVIHGDLKPRNVRLDRRNAVRVMDFGIAKALSDTRNATVNLFASAAYCSPERLESGQMDADSDLWSVGVLLYQMISGRLPFGEETKVSLERRIRSAQGPDPLPETCPEPLRRIIAKMLARDIRHRYQTAAEVNDDLARFQTGQPVLALDAATLDAATRDNEATVRSASPIGVPDAERTIRTGPGFPVGSLPKMTPVPPLPRQRPGRALMGCMAVALICILATAGFALSQWNFSDAAGKLKNDIQTEQVSDMNVAWNRYQKLNSRTHLPGLLWGARNALRKKLVAAADDVIAEYRDSDAPAIFEPQWIEARNNLSKALELDPDSNDILGRIRLCEGHIDRIDAGGLHGPARQKKLNTAVGKFNEAADRLRHSPDPYLGLARLYVYDLNDVERAEDALNKAARNGHPMGHRETAQLADGYRRRADRFMRESHGFGSDSDQERDYLDKARQDYVHAEDLYRQAGLFGDSSRNEMLAVQGQQRVEQMLASHPTQPGVTAQ